MSHRAMHADFWVRGLIGALVGGWLDYAISSKWLHKTSGG